MQTLGLIFGAAETFNGTVLFHPVRVLLLMVWFYYCLYLVQYMEDHPIMPAKYKGWLNLLSLAFAPFVFFGVYVVRIVQKAEQEKLGFMGVLKGVVNGSMFKVGRGLVGSRGASSIMLFNSDGKALDEIYGSDNKSNLSGILSMAETIVWDSLNSQASDILIDPVGTDKYTVRFRVDGKLRVFQEIDSSTCTAVVNSIKALSGMDIAEKRRAQDGAFTAKLDDGVASFRVASSGVMNGEKLSIRILSSNAGLYNIDKLGFKPADVKTIKDSIHKQSGMILVCGPTGSGKTTSLYAMLSSINALERNIITIEDPVEYVLSNVSQIEINEKAEITFAKSLRSILRQDPDVICVGEIRDDETAQIAMQASNTGHLLFATLHSKSNFSAIVRLLDLGIKPLLLASSLDLIVSQRLVRKLCDDCKKPASLNDSQKKELQSRGIDTNKIMVANGCRMCGGTGYRGRVGIYDVLKLNDEIKGKLFTNNLSPGQIKELGKQFVKSKLRKEAMKMVFEGVTTFDEIKSVI